MDWILAQWDFIAGRLTAKNCSYANAEFKSYKKKIEFMIEMREELPCHTNTFSAIAYF